MKRKEINIYNCKNTIKITVNIKSKQDKKYITKSVCSKPSILFFIKKKTFSFLQSNFIQIQFQIKVTIPLKDPNKFGVKAAV